MRSVTKLVVTGLALFSLVACGAPQLTAPQPQAQVGQAGFKTQWLGRGFGIGGPGLGGFGWGAFGYPYGGAFGLGCGVGYGVPFSMLYNPVFAGIGGFGAGCAASTGVQLPDFGYLYTGIGPVY